MSHAHGARSASMLLALAFTAVGCGGSNPTGVPYVSLGRDLAGVYNPTDPSSGPNVRIVLGTRHNVSGRYDNASGQEVRFYGTWEHRRDGRLVLSFDGTPGLPTEVVLEVARETTTIDITPGVMPGLPQPDPLFRTTDVVRLRGELDIGGTLVELDLFRLAITTGSGDGGLTSN